MFLPYCMFAFKYEGKSLTVSVLQLWHLQLYDLYSTYFGRMGGITISCLRSCNSETEPELNSSPHCLQYLGKYISNHIGFEIANQYVALRIGMYQASAENAGKDVEGITFGIGLGAYHFVIENRSYHDQDDEIFISASMALDSFSVENN